MSSLDHRLEVGAHTRSRDSRSNRAGCSAADTPVGLAARSIRRHIRPKNNEARLRARHRAVLDAEGYNEQVAGMQKDITVSKLNGEFPVEQDECLVLVIVGMPTGGSCALGDFDESSIRLGEYLLRPEFGEAFERIGEADLVVHGDLSKRLMDVQSCQPRRKIMSGPSAHPDPMTSVVWRGVLRKREAIGKGGVPEAELNGDAAAELVVWSAPVGADTLVLLKWYFHPVVARDCSSSSAARRRARMTPATIAIRTSATSNAPYATAVGSSPKRPTARPAARAGTLNAT